MKPVTALISLALTLTPFAVGQTAINGQGALDRFDAGMAAIDTGDFATARLKFGEACQWGVGTACFNLGLMYWLGDGVPKDEVTAFDYYQKACRGRESDNKYINAQACWNLAVAHSQGLGNFTKDPAKAKEFAEKACANGFENPFCEKDAD